MADLKPPQIVADERETLLALLGYHRESLIRKVADLDDAAAATVFVPSGTTLLWLIGHVAYAESIWVEHRFAGLDMPPASVDTVARAVAHYRATSTRVDAIVRGATLDDLCRRPPAEPLNLRWVIAHLLEETARHAGHADILRELLDGATGR